MTGPAVYPSLAGRAAFVTGGAARIVVAVVRALAAQGARVHFVDIDEAGGRALANETGAIFEPCDVRDLPRLLAVTAAVEGVTILVNDAANDQRDDTATVRPQLWRERMAVNLEHVFFIAGDPRFHGCGRRRGHRKLWLIGLADGGTADGCLRHGQGCNSRSHKGPRT